MIRTLIRLAGVLLVLVLAGCGEEEALPEMLPIGEFALTDQDGRAFGSAELRGKVWVADFIFTSCPDICPVMSTQMANLHRRIADADVRFVSITVDPERDTPEVLREYAARFRADSRWRFLTGEAAVVRRTIEQGFRLPVGDREARPGGGYDILHGSRFALVDRRGILRGLYETDAEGLERLERDVARLLREDA